ncbi:MAG: phosphoribosylglycinamide formyltransferase 2 [Candidatus Fluviicola riflensis]|nr:MAG: phosphoribosylglycinamide formyltransferase 2 [Candidatus Fluviicola riflensis]OGS77690.1 MAG: phosphoribosylglycinamide formyltransferase 2 [Candidatus Fluviicola riflensis]OGS84273.1 MAG: phosphoribosylglycinamide formyltransferase 2 [Fluviicola sp. RIFCSPHIGHO2_12_FULL_43_24]OGS84756.1 MAG: phosphoribosylglycinamide formyltransferase 2 [Fluviicola sp. RIFCSPHIGHO2_01_FULL_43_53]
MQKKILLLGSGELGKEVVIALQRLGQTVIAVDSYENAPAMQVADSFEVINMLNGDELDRIVAKHQPELIVPEIEAIRTERFYDYETQGIQVVPSAKAANFTMNRKAIRDLAAIEVGVKTAKYKYATTLEGFREAVAEIGIPCVVKPLMSSSGKGQSVIKAEAEIDKAWIYAIEGSRGDLKEVIVEEFIKFDYEITLLTVTQQNGPTLFCPPIGHRQERGDYQESWQPMPMTDAHLKEAQEMAGKVTQALGGAGIWGVEFFITQDGAYFSELSPRPHDTGMVTLAGTQNLSEFELHARAILGLPIPTIELFRNGASAVILADRESDKAPQFDGLTTVLSQPQTDLRLFGKPTTRPYRRMGVVLTYGTDSAAELTEKAKALASEITIVY